MKRWQVLVNDEAVGAVYEDKAYAEELAAEWGGVVVEAEEYDEEQE